MCVSMYHTLFYLPIYIFVETHTYITANTFINIFSESFLNGGEHLQRLEDLCADKITHQTIKSEVFRWSSVLKDLI